VNIARPRIDNPALSATLDGQKQPPTGKEEKVFGILENFFRYLISPDAWMVMYVFNHDLPLWLCFLIPIAHSIVWMAVKTRLFWVGTQMRQRHMLQRTSVLVVRPSRSGRWRRLWRLCKHWVHRAYHWGRKRAHNKKMTERAFFWFGVEPQLQKAGCAILGILWPRYGYRGFIALCLGGSCQVACFCLLFMLFGKTIANIAMYCIFVPLGLFALYRWIRRNGASQTK